MAHYWHWKRTHVVKVFFLCARRQITKSQCRCETQSAESERMRQQDAVKYNYFFLFLIFRRKFHHRPNNNNNSLFDVGQADRRRRYAPTNIIQFKRLLDESCQEKVYCLGIANAVATDIYCRASYEFGMAMEGSPTTQNVGWSLSRNGCVRTQHPQSLNCVEHSLDKRLPIYLSSALPLLLLSLSSRAYFI